LSETLKPYFNVVKDEAAKEATIYIYGAIGGIDFDTWTEINTAAKLSAEFQAIEKDVDTIHVRINSPGGRVFEGLGIYNLLFGSEKNIITYNDGLCGSMAALILLAGDEIHAYSNSLLMVHNSSGSYYGNKLEVEEQLKAGEKIDQAMGTTIEDRLNISAEEVAKDYLNYKDNWYNAEEAKEIGFYDTIIKKKKAQVPKDVKSLSPVQLFGQYAAMTFNIPTEKSTPNNEKMKKPNSFPNLEAALGLNAPLAINDDGSYLNEDQKATIERTFSANATALKNAQDEAAQVKTDLTSALSEAATALSTEKDNNAAAIATLKAAATLAGVEALAEDATAEVIQTALTAKIEELNKLPGATHTTGAAQDKSKKEFAYIDTNNSIYSQFQ